MSWDGSPLCVRYMVQHRNIFFTNAYVRSSLELSISFLHCCVNILTIDSLNKSMNLFVSPTFCDSQIWSSPVSWRIERIREHQFVKSMPSSSRSILQAFLTGSLWDSFRILHQYFTAFMCCRMISGNRPVSPYIAGVGVCFLTPGVDLINFRWIFSRSFTSSPVYHISLPYSSMGNIWQSNALNAIVGDNLPTTGWDCLPREKMLSQQDGKKFLLTRY